MTVQRLHEPPRHRSDCRVGFGINEDVSAHSPDRIYRREHDSHSSTPFATPTVQERDYDASGSAHASAGMFCPTDWRRLA
jgi:hypothetical protein